MKKYFTKYLPVEGENKLMLCSHDIKRGDLVCTPPRGQAFKIVAPISSGAFWLTEGETLLETDVRVYEGSLIQKHAQVRCDRCNVFH